MRLQWKFSPQGNCKSRSQSRETLLDKEEMSRNDDRVTFSITYYQVFKNIRNILEELHIILSPDEQIFPQ